MKGEGLRRKGQRGLRGKRGIGSGLKVKGGDLRVKGGGLRCNG